MPVEPSGEQSLEPGLVLPKSLAFLFEPVVPVIDFIEYGRCVVDQNLAHLARHLKPRHIRAERAANIAQLPTTGIRGRLDVLLDCAPRPAQSWTTFEPFCPIARSRNDSTRCVSWLVNSMLLQTTTRYARQRSILYKVPNVPMSLHAGIRQRHGRL
jgi:hypothetical protein